MYEGLCLAHPGNPRRHIEGESRLIDGGTYSLADISQLTNSLDLRGRHRKRRNGWPIAVVDHSIQRCR